MGDNGYNEGIDAQEIAESIVEQEAYERWAGVKDAEDIETSSTITEQRKPPSPIHKAITAVKLDDIEREYIQQLYMGNYLDQEQAADVVAAIVEFKRYHLTLEPIIALVAAWCGVNQGVNPRSRVSWLGDTFTRQHITAQNVPWNNKDREKYRERSGNSDLV